MNQPANVRDFTKRFLRLHANLLGYLRKLDAAKEEAEDIIMQLYLKTLRLLHLNPTFIVETDSYLFVSAKHLWLDLRKRNFVFPQHQEGHAGWFTGEDISDIDLANRGIGNYPSKPDTLIWLSQLEARFGGNVQPQRQAEVIDIVQEAIVRMAGSAGDERQPFKVTDQSDDNLVNWYLEKYGGDEYQEMLDRAFYDREGYNDFKAYRKRIAERLTKILQRHEAYMRDVAGHDRWSMVNPEKHNGKYVQSN